MSASKVLPNLWVGGSPPKGLDISKVADVLVLAAEEIQPKDKEFPGVSVVRCPIPDGRLTIKQISIVSAAGDAVAALMRDRRKVLCTCHMGLNRSALVACVAMCRLGMSPSDSIRVIRQARGNDAMTNPLFPKYLDTIILGHALVDGETCRPGEDPYLAWSCCS